MGQGLLIHEISRSHTTTHHSQYYSSGRVIRSSQRPLTDNTCFWHDSPQWARASSFTRFLDHTQRRTTVSRTPLDECSGRGRDLYLTTHNIHNGHFPGGIRTHNPSRRAAADLRLRLRDQIGRQLHILKHKINNVYHKLQHLFFMYNEFFPHGAHMQHLLFP